MAGVLKLEDLSPAASVVAVALDDLICTFGGAKEVSCAIDGGNGELKVLSHTLRGVKGVLEEAEPL